MIHRSLAVPATLLLVFLGAITVRTQPASSGHSLVFNHATPGNGVKGVAAGADGSTWFSSNTCETGLPITADAVQRDPGTGRCRGLLGRLRADGSLAYLSYVGGASGETTLSSVGLDAAGNVYVAGSTSSPDFPTTPGAYDRTCGDDGDCVSRLFYGFCQCPMSLPVPDGFVMKLSPGGDRSLYATYIGGLNRDEVRAMAVDSSGGVHLTGETIGEDFPVTAGALQTSFAYSTDPEQDRYADAFYARLSPDGSALEYSTYLGGQGPESASGVTVDSTGTAFVTGLTTAHNFPTVNAFRPQMTDPYPDFRPYDYSGRDGYLASFGGAGVRFSTYLGGSASDSATGVAVAGDRVYVVGGTCSADFLAGTSPTNCGDFAAVVHADGSALARVVLLASNGIPQSINAVAADASQTLYVGGSRAASDTDWDGYFAIVPLTDADSGQPAYSTLIAAATNDSVAAVAYDGAGERSSAASPPPASPPSRIGIHSWRTSHRGHRLPRAATSSSTRGMRR